MPKAGYEYLLAYKITVPIYDYTVEFCNRCSPYRSHLPNRPAFPHLSSPRTHDQMVQAARSGSANILEGAKQNSLAGYIKLCGVARGSLEELLRDYLAYARQHGIEIWNKEKAIGEIREKGTIWEIIRKNRTLPNSPHFPDLPNQPETAINLMITLIHQANYLTDKLIKSLEEKHTREGGFSENLLKKRLQYRNGGFTMIELMLTTVLIGTLAAFTFTNLWLQQSKARDTRRKAALDGLRVALISYQVDKGSFPPPADLVCASENLKPYLNRVPCEPDGTSFFYQAPGSDKFIAYTKLEWEKDPIIREKSCLAGCGPNYEYNYYVDYGMEPELDFNAVESGDIPTLVPAIPMCGSVTKYCYANVCSACCPGSQFRCSDTGSWCIPDSSCGN